MQKNKCFLLALLFIMAACQQEEKGAAPKQVHPSKLFTLLSSDKTGVTFSNDVPLKDKSRYLFYQYSINGAGVSVGDVNNDNLPDLFFTANAKENRLYLNKGNMQFQDITESAGVQGSIDFWSTGATMADINNDGFLDIYVSQGGDKESDLRKNLLYINNGDLTFIERAEEYGVADRGHSTQSTFFDFDLDGDLDLFVMNHSANWFEKKPREAKDKRGVQSDRLYENKNGKFIDVSAQAGLENDMYGFGLGLVVGDVNGDLYPDIYICNDYNEHDFFYLNNTDGTFTESIKETTKHTSFYSMGNDMADYDNDGLLDVITVDMVAEDNFRQKTLMAGMNPTEFFENVDRGCHYQYMYNALQKNNGNNSFSEVGQMAGLPNTDWSWAPLFADFDNDGWKDVYITNGFDRDFHDKDALAAAQEYETVNITEDGQRKKGLSIPITDYYNLFPQKKLPNYAYRNKGDLTFEKASFDWGLGQFGLSQGAVYSDLDNDGDLDLVVNNLDAKAWIYQNETDAMEQSNYLKVAFNGQEKNRFGLGAKVVIAANGIEQTQELTLTRGYLSSVEPIVHFGLGATERVEKLTVSWPDGKQQVLTDISANQMLTLSYAEATTSAKKKEKKLFTEKQLVSFQHQENEFDDYAKEVLLPHKNSQHGPGMAVADVNGDGLEDFYVGGAANQSGVLYVQTTTGGFSAKTGAWSADRKCEDLNAHFFDADSDGDPDLYVVSGGNEFEHQPALLQDRLYLNNGSGTFYKAANALPQMEVSGQAITSADMDGDGDLDLFVGGRLVVGKYPFTPRSYVLKNEGGIFTDVTAFWAPAIKNAGLVTDATWVDWNTDGKQDLLVVGEWMSVILLENNGHTLVDVSAQYGLDKQKGWWKSVEVADFDQDGDLDFVLGNNGLNYKYHATQKEPFHVYAHDFDKNGSMDIVLGYFNKGTLYPVRGRQCSSEQCPEIKEKFATYSAFGSADLKSVYGADLDLALHYTVTNFASVYIENKRADGLLVRKLPQQAQFSVVNAIVAEDIDVDGHLDLILSGNLHVSEVETPRNDASIGVVLKGNGDGTFAHWPVNETGYFTPGDVKDIALLKQNNKLLILVANNDAAMQVFEF